jgi:predicted aspartyl protease
MKFKYRYVRDKYSATKLARMPFLPVRLAYRAKSTTVVGLIDTGASDCLFDCDVAEDLGINLKDTDREKEYFGIGNQSVIGYVHEIQFQIQGFSEWIEMDAGFLETRLPYPLLGQSGFFDNYEVTLKRYRGRFEIKSRTHLH